MTIVVLGAGGVGGLLGGALEQAGEPVVVLGRESTVATIAEQGLRVQSVTLGSFTAHPRAVSVWREPCECLIIATKAGGLAAALERMQSEPQLVLPLLNGFDHLEPLRARFGREAVIAGTIRVESDRPQPGVVVHTSPLLRVEMASAWRSAVEPMRSLAERLRRAGVEAHVIEPAGERSEAQVMWSKLVRLAPLACMTSAYDLELGRIRSEERLRAELVSAIEECCAVARAEGVEADPAVVLAELDHLHDSQGSSMRRDVASGRPSELDAIAGAVLRAGARHGLECPTIERLAGMIAKRAAQADATPTIYARL